MGTGDMAEQTLLVLLIVKARRTKTISAPRKVVIEPLDVLAPGMTGEFGTPVRSPLLSFSSFCPTVVVWLYFNRMVQALHDGVQFAVC